MARETSNAAIESLLIRWHSLYKVTINKFIRFHIQKLSIITIFCLKYLSLLTTWQLFDLTRAGDTKSFVAALDALSDASPEELAFLHPLSVRVTCTMIFCQT